MPPNILTLIVGLLSMVAVGSLLKWRGRVSVKIEGGGKGKQLQAVVVEGHNEAMGWVAEWGGRNVDFVHFDSHPDMSIPVVPDGVWEEVVQGNPSWVASATPFTDIADWITPLIVSNRVKNVVWVAPVWSDQFKHGSYNISIYGQIGRGVGSLRFTATPHVKMDYWEPLGVFNKPAHPNDVLLRNFTFTVTSAASLTLVVTPPYIVDIDEDYLVCDNPVLSALIGLVGEQAAEGLGVLMDFASPDEVRAAKKSGTWHHIETRSNKTISPHIKDWVETWDGPDEVFDLADTGYGLPSDIPTSLRVVEGRVEALQKTLSHLMSMHGLPQGLTLATSPGYVPHPHHPHIHSMLLSSLSATYPTPSLPTLPPPGTHILYLNTTRFQVGTVLGHGYGWVAIEAGRVEWRDIKYTSPDKGKVLGMVGQGSF